MALLLPKGTGYEDTKLKYVVPESNHSYTPDFSLKKNVFIEVKGYLDPATRKKHLLLKEQHPEIEIKFFFDKSNNKIYKGSKKTYAQWCDDNNFDWSDSKRGIPKEWLK